MIVKPKIYFVNEREVYMVGDSVGVCWNLEKRKKQIECGEGVICTANSNVRSSKPYIDFVSIRKNGEEFYEDEDSPVDGGIEVDFAKKIVEELKLAIEYISTLT